MPKRHLNLPKSVTISNGSFLVRIYSKIEKKMYNVGTYSTVEKAIEERDKWLINNYDKVEGYLPRGVSRHSNGLYDSQVSFRKNTTQKGTFTRHLGRFATIDEAVDFRKNFILGLL